jgi:hypothetical protein
VELRKALRITAQPRRQELQRDGLAQPEIVGAIDLTHPAAPEQPDDAIPLFQDDTRREASVIDRAGRREPAAGGGLRRSVEVDLEAEALLGPWAYSWIRHKYQAATDRYGRQTSARRIIVRGDGGRRMP